jgi:hypothetical protein
VSLLLAIWKRFSETGLFKPKFSIYGLTQTWPQVLILELKAWQQAILLFKASGLLPSFGLLFA